MLLLELNPKLATSSTDSPEQTAPRGPCGRPGPEPSPDCPAAAAESPLLVFLLNLDQLGSASTPTEQYQHTF